MNKLTRPVLFGENGSATIEYDDYRDIVRSSLLVGVRYLALAMMFEYRGRPTRSYDNTRNQLDAIYASERLRLPFDGGVLIGYRPRRHRRHGHDLGTSTTRKPSGSRTVTAPTCSQYGLAAGTTSPPQRPAVSATTAASPR